MKEFDKIIGYDFIKVELERICDLMKNPDKYKKLGVSVPSGLVMYGDPGVGKTLFATCFIEACNRNSFICRKNKSEGDFINQIKHTFDEAKKNTPSIILLDDFDKFANEDKDHKDAEEYVAIQSCIDEIKDYDVFVFATANDLCKVPESLLRAGRFDISIRVKNPKYEDAIKIIKYYLSKKSYVGTIDVVEIAKILHGRSCAELESIINQAGIYAGFENKDKIEFSDIVRACKRIIYDAPETIKNEGAEQSLETAYHEAGHAIVSEILEPQSVTLISIEEHEGNIGGFTGYYRDEKYWNSIDLMKKRVCTLLGGKCATEVVFGKADVGCTSDIDRAVQVIRRMITDYCEAGFDKVYLGYGQSENHKYNQERAIADELHKYYNIVKELLINNKKFLDIIANKLIDKKTLIGKDIQLIKAKYIDNKKSMSNILDIK